MFKKGIIFFSITVLVFQTLIFNLGLYSFILISKSLSEKNRNSFQIILSQAKYKKLEWMNENEFVFGNYLLDVESSKKEENTITLICKVDLREGNFLKELSRHVKNGKIYLFSILYKQLEPLNFSFSLPSSMVIYNQLCVSFIEAGLPNTSPPPKA